MKLYLSENGQVGLFPEQRENWAWIDRQIDKYSRQHNVSIDGPESPIKILNAFGTVNS